MTAPFTCVKGADFVFCAVFTNFIPKPAGFCATCGFPEREAARASPSIIPHPHRFVNTFFKNLFYFIFQKPLAFCFWICYTIIVPKGERRADTEKNFSKKFEKSLDNPFHLWYNIIVPRERGAHLSQGTKNLILKGIDHYD